MRDLGVSQERPSDDIVLGDDWIAPATSVEQELQANRARRGFFSLHGSPLTRKIITLNLIAITLLVAGVLYLNSSRKSLVYQSAVTVVSEASLVSDVFKVQLSAAAGERGVSFEESDAVATLGQLDLRAGVEVLVFDAQGSLIARDKGRSQLKALVQRDGAAGKTIISDGLAKLWDGIGSIIGEREPAPRAALETQIAQMVQSSLKNGEVQQAILDPPEGVVFSAVAPIYNGESLFGAVALATPSGEIDELVRADREQVLQLFVVALLVSVGLSLVLASTIANPLADLAEAAELGRDRDSRKVKSGRIRIPDLSARPDEIGRLSRALRSMVKALYNRIDSNEQFAADVAHEIKNPLASLQSAVGTLRMVKRDDQREKLMEVIEHDVRRLDRLVSDISNASRLDAELVKEAEEEFNLLNMLENLNMYLGEDARNKGIDYITDLPDAPIMIQGLEARLAQVFVNLISNAISFCEDGDAIRVWARQRDNRVLVVVEDTGPGIPEQALTKVFKRFYSQRPVEHFGNNSGLGLAISKQIVEAHGGVIWAENIHPTEADAMSEPLGARFVVGLPV